jgi:hypothetical protein
MSAETIARLHVAVDDIEPAITEARTFDRQLTALKVCAAISIASAKSERRSPSASHDIAKHKAVMLSGSYTTTPIALRLKRRTR